MNVTFSQIFNPLISGFGTTLLLFALTLVFATPFGLIIAFGSMSSLPPIKWLTKGFVWVIRGTPLMLQIIVVFYIPGLWFDYPMKSRMLAVTVAFVINYAAYFSEIFRGGIESMPKGQYEAGQVLGLTKAEVFFKIILPQVIKRVVPPMGNEIITLVKDTSLARIISVGELIKSAEALVNKFAVISPLFYAGAFYLLFNGLLTLLFSFVEKKLNYYRG